MPLRLATKLIQKEKGLPLSLPQGLATKLTQKEKGLLLGLATKLTQRCCFFSCPKQRAELVESYKQKYGTQGKCKVLAGAVCRFAASRLMSLAFKLQKDYVKNLFLQNKCDQRKCVS